MSTAGLCLLTGMAGGAAQAETSPQAQIVTGTLLRIGDAAPEQAVLKDARGVLHQVNNPRVATLQTGDRVTMKATNARASVGDAMSIAGHVGTKTPITSVTKNPTMPNRSYTRAAHTVSFVLAIPAGVNAAANTSSAVRSQLSKVSAYWSEQSGGGITFTTAKVVGPIKLKASCSDYSALWNEAARAAGFSQKANAHLVVSLPDSAYEAGCSYGLGTVGSSINSGGLVYVADTAWPVLAHELGHNLSMNHAAALDHCSLADLSLVRSSGSITTSNSSCGIDHYGDAWDVMAASAQNSAGSLSSPQAYRSGLLPGTSVTSVTSGTVTATLSPVSSLGGMRAVRVVDPKSKETYYLEYRTRTGRDASLYQNMQSGVRVLRDVGVSAAWPSTIALDATPTANRSARHIPVGATFRSYSGGIRVTVRSASAASAVVSVTVG